MKKSILFGLLLVSLHSVSQNGISFGLHQHILDHPEESVEVIIKFNGEIDHQDLRSSFEEQGILPKDRVAPVILAAMELNNRYTRDFSHETFMMNFPALRKLWIANSIVMSLSSDQIIHVSKMSIVEWVAFNKTRFAVIDRPIQGESQNRVPGGHEPGHGIINAPPMWQLGYTGAGTTLLTYDTGFWPDHPAIAERYMGNFFPQSQTWFGYDLASPGDKINSHGTHVTGTVLGLDPSTNDSIGVAPGAYFIATDPIVTSLADVRTFEELAWGFEWALNPDGDLTTTNDIPDVINNSWGRPVDVDVEPCNEIMSAVFALVETAGIANVFSAGNSGPDQMTISAPHNINQGLVNSFTVGAVNLNTDHTIAGFSSRGPSFCPGTGSFLIKPEVVAPGVNVRSSVGHDEYDFYQGTSMASPHVSGAVLLLKEAFPYLTGEEILLGLYYSAIDLGDPGEDNTYGNGLIDVFAAYNYLIDQGNVPVPPIDNPYELVIEEISSPSDQVQCGGSFLPEVLVSNQGDSTINALTIDYKFLGTTISGGINLITDLAPGMSQTFSLGSVNTDLEGNYELMIQAKLDPSLLENDTINNKRIFRGNVRPERTVPFFEDFEDGISDVNWYNYNDDLAITWDTVATNGLQWSTRSAWMNFYEYNPRLDQKDELHSPTFDLTSTENELFLEFDYAYQRRGNASVLKDTLRIFTRSDCDSDWDLIWEAHSDSLKTIPDNSTQAFFPDSAHHWKQRIFNISNYIGDQEFQFKIHTSNRNGNNLFLDNVRLYYGSDPVGTLDLEELSFLVFPNPSDGIYIVEGSIDLRNISWNLKNVQGTSIPFSFEQLAEKESIRIDLNNHPSGVYFLELFSKQKKLTIKLIKY